VSRPHVAVRIATGLALSLVYASSYAADLGLRSLLPVARLARMQPANLVKVFASER